MHTIIISALSGILVTALVYIIAMREDPRPAPPPLLLPAPKPRRWKQLDGITRRRKSKETK